MAMTVQTFKRTVASITRWCATSTSQHVLDRVEGSANPLR
ncbi:hypothetical protein MINT15_39220 [Saccharomonospora viridis]|uniref:Uncharacterized protein n=1 Tax=Saccharomonospora viridis TaxID=1852 RepID=A0A837D8K7_9PSEU|nr:hypothetical protein MINT15_39220 [Saccharomonospora viridis]